MLETVTEACESIALISAKDYSYFDESIPNAEIREGRYLVRFARTPYEVDAALRLRFEVFNLELGEGLDSSIESGLDRDRFDEACHHLLVFDTDEDRVVGTYRMQTAEMALSAAGFYSATEFDLSSFASDLLMDAVELGRASVARSHRNTHVLFLLWKGIAMYVAHNRKRYLFGCCSITTQDERLGVDVLSHLKQNEQMHPRLCAMPLPGFECNSDDAAGDDQVIIPKLFRTYLRFGAQVCSRPAIDRSFKTIDFLVLLDIAGMNEAVRRMFFGA